jgi:hypothetical protein
MKNLPRAIAKGFSRRPLSQLYLAGLGLSILWASLILFFFRTQGPISPGNQQEPTVGILLVERMAERLRITFQPLDDFFPQSSLVLRYQWLFPNRRDLFLENWRKNPPLVGQQPCAWGNPETWQHQDINPWQTLVFCPNQNAIVWDLSFLLGPYPSGKLLVRWIERDRTYPFQLVGRKLILNESRMRPMISPTTTSELGPEFKSRPELKGNQSPL